MWFDDLLVNWLKSNFIPWYLSLGKVVISCGYTINESASQLVLRLRQETRDRDKSIMWSVISQSGDHSVIIDQSEVSSVDSGNCERSVTRCQGSECQNDEVWSPTDSTRRDSRWLCVRSLSSLGCSVSPVSSVSVLRGRLRQCETCDLKRARSLCSMASVYLY